MKTKCNYCNLEFTYQNSDIKYYEVLRIYYVVCPNEKCKKHKPLN